MSHLKNNKKVLNRISRIQGQLNAIQTSMKELDTPCSEVLQQVAAVRGAVNGLMQELIEEHLRHHVLDGLHYNEEELEVFLGIIKRYKE